MDALSIGWHSLLCWLPLKYKMQERSNKMPSWIGSAKISWYRESSACVPAKRHWSTNVAIMLKLVARIKCHWLFILVQMNTTEIHSIGQLTEGNDATVCLHSSHCFYSSDHAAVCFAVGWGHSIGKATSKKSDAENDFLLIRRNVSLLLEPPVSIKSIEWLSIEWLLQQKCEASTLSLMKVVCS